MRKTVKKYRGVQAKSPDVQADGRRMAVETSPTRTKVGRKKPYANRIREFSNMAPRALSREFRESDDGLCVDLSGL